MKTYLVTGGAGFVGSNFIIYMLKKYNDIKIINIDKLTYAGNLENLKEVQENPNYKFFQIDICNKDSLEKIFEEKYIDYVVNFAAESHVDRSIRDPEVFVNTNVLGTVNLLNIAKQYWQQGDKFQEGKKFLQISTDEVYGSLGETGYFDETNALDPHSPYSSSKAAADLMVKAYFDTYGMPINVTRCSNNYGPFQFPEKLIPLIINNSLQKKDLPIYGDGLNIRDWIYVVDQCRAIDMVINNGRVGAVYNIGGQNEKTNIHLVETIIKQLNESVDSSITEDLIKFVRDRKGHDRRYAIDATKIREELGWQPKVMFDEGIKITINWYLENREWLQRVTTGEYQEFYKKYYG